MSPNLNEISSLFEELATNHMTLGHNPEAKKIAFLSFDKLDFEANELNPNMSFPFMSMALPKRDQLQQMYRINEVGILNKNTVFSFAILSPVKDFSRDYANTISICQGIVDDIVIRLRQLAIEGRETCSWLMESQFEVVEAFKVGPFNPGNLYGFSISINIPVNYVIPAQKNNMVWSA